MLAKPVKKKKRVTRKSFQTRPPEISPNHFSINQADFGGKKQLTKKRKTENFFFVLYDLRKSSNKSDHCSVKYSRKKVKLAIEEC